MKPQKKTHIVLALLLALLAASVSSALAPAADAQDASCAEGTLVDTNCVIEGAPTTYGPPTCPVSTNVLEDPVTGECYQLNPGATTTSCPAPFNESGTSCEIVNPGSTLSELAVFTCPDGAIENIATSQGQVYITECTTPAITMIDCGIFGALGADGCRVSEPLVADALACEPDYQLINQGCFRIVPPSVTAAPSGTSSGFVFFQPPTPGKITVEYELACFGQIARLTSLDVDSQGGASLQLLTLNGSFTIGQDLAPGSATQLGVVTNSSTDTVIVTGPAMAPACDGTAAGSTTTSTTTQTTGGVTNEVVGPLGAGPVTALVAGQDVSLQVPGALAIWLSPNNDISVTVDGITVATAPASDGTVSFVVPAGDPLPTSVSFHGRLLNGTAYREVVSIP